MLVANTKEHIKRKNNLMAKERKNNLMAKERKDGLL